MNGTPMPRQARANEPFMPILMPHASNATAIIAAVVAAALTRNIFVIAAAIIVADAIPAIAYGAAASTQAMAFENAIAAHLDTVIATL